MIAFINGFISDSTPGQWIVLVGSEAQGEVGYLCNVPTYLKAPATRQRVQLFIYTHVREEAFDLYGFETRSEKELFLVLMKCNGIGPRAAMTLLSSAKPKALLEAILNQDKDYLTSLQGVGKKTAEKIIVEIGDVLRKKIQNGAFADLMTGGDSLPQKTMSFDSLEGERLSLFEQARLALLTLGYREQEIRDRLLKIVQVQAKPTTRVEDIIKTVLQQMGN